MTDPSDIRASLLDWYDEHRRDLPWRGIADPYPIWVSEVMSQQTRIETVVEYWTRWMERFPTVRSLAEADSDEVMRLWSGLGYYRRARYLLQAAREVVDDHGGELPGTAAELRNLPGIGAYTAGAVASIAFDEPVPAIDGNVTRVVARLFAVEGEPHRADFRRAIREHADRLVDPSRPGCSNQAMMELGATICTPRGPGCLLCPIRADCEGFATGDPAAFPPPRRRTAPRPERRTTIVVVDDERRVWMRKSTSEGLLAGLWEFPNVVADDRTPAEVAAAELAAEVTATQAVGEVEHVFSHIHMTYDVHRVRLGDGDAPEGGQWLSAEELDDIGVSAAMRKVADVVAPAG